MQIWVLPDRLANLGLTVQDLQRALKDQNRESAAGVLGQQPMTDLDVTIPITAQGRLSSVGEFEEIVVRANPDGSIIRCASWRAFRSKRRPITPKAVSTGEMPRCSTSTCCRAPTPWRWPTR